MVIGEQIRNREKRCEKAYAMHGRLDTIEAALNAIEIVDDTIAAC